jgi:hypothetical protein
MFTYKLIFVTPTILRNVMGVTSCLNMLTYVTSWLHDHNKYDTSPLSSRLSFHNVIQGADPGFQVRGAHLKKLRRAKGGAKMFEVFRVNITILRQKIIFYPIPEGSANIFGVFCAPGAPPPPPWIRPCIQ